MLRLEAANYRGLLMILLVKERLILQVFCLLSLCYFMSPSAVDRILCELFFQHIIPQNRHHMAIKIKSHQNKLFGLPIFTGLHAFLPLVLEDFFFFEINISLLRPKTFKGKLQ